MTPLTFPIPLIVERQTVCALPLSVGQYPLCTAHSAASLIHVIPRRAVTSPLGVRQFPLHSADTLVGGGAIFGSALFALPIPLLLIPTLPLFLILSILSILCIK